MIHGVMELLDLNIFIIYMKVQNLMEPVKVGEGLFIEMVSTIMVGLKIIMLMVMEYRNIQMVKLSKDYLKMVNLKKIIMSNMTKILSKQNNLTLKTIF